MAGASEPLLQKLGGPRTAAGERADVYVEAFAGQAADQKTELFLGTRPVERGDDVQDSMFHG